jgi:hypothetical protein
MCTSLHTHNSSGQAAARNLLDVLTLQHCCATVAVLHLQYLYLHLRVPLIKSRL